MIFKLPTRLVDFALLFHHAAEKGVILLLSAVFAIILANTSAQWYYFELIQENFEFLGFKANIMHIVNDCLMVLFFLMVGLEIKREMIEGHLSTKEQRILPFIGACGGVLCPVTIYYLCNAGSTQAMYGWAVPAATDIAFALGMLALLGKGLPTSLRVFLTALAIIDDLIAVIIIAVFYSDNLVIEYLLGIASVIVLLFFLCRARFHYVSVYLLIGLLLWYFFIKTGIHATVAGVVLGMFLPIKAKDDNSSPLKKLEKALAPLTSYIILPLFALLNSGVNLFYFSYREILSSVSLGIIAGLFVGKQLGVFISSFILIKTKICRMPQGVNYMQFYAVSVLCGIGFTMSLFVAKLAFVNSQELLNQAKAGILVGSLFSVIYSGIIIRLMKR